MTIPIYLGATKISDFFNSEGVIQIPSQKIDAVEKIIKDSTKENYESRIPAIIDNFLRVKNYLCIEDYIWNNYNQYFM
jgi:hypothetical protein